MGANNNRSRVQTTETAFALIETIAERDEAGITELANELDLAKSTVHRHLKTLERLEYVVKVENQDVYRLGFRFLLLGEHTRTRSEHFAMAAEKVEELAEKTEERAQFIVEEHGKAVYIYREIGAHAVQTDSAIGKRIPLHATAAGKSILAFLPRERTREIVEHHGLTSVTENTIVDLEEMCQELEVIRERGYSFNDQENTNGLRAVGVPVLYNDGSVFGALSISGPTHRIHSEEVVNQFSSLLLGTANELELKIKYS